MKIWRARTTVVICLPILEEGTAGLAPEKKVKDKCDLNSPAKTEQSSDDD